MNLPSHVAVAYLVGRAGVPRPVPGWVPWALGLTALLPDAVDKTLHYGFGLFASGRTTLHNVFVLTLVVGVFLVCKRGRHSALALVVVAGIGSHIVVDFAYSLVRASYMPFPEISDWAGYVLFPLCDPVLSKGFTYGVVDAAVEVPLVLGTLWLWLRDGGPGLRGWRPVDRLARLARGG